MNIKKRLPDLLILLAALICAATVLEIHRVPGNISIAPAISSFYLLRPESVTEEVISEYAGVRRTYVFDLTKAPKNSGRSRSLFVYLRHTFVRLEMGGKTYVDTSERKAAHIGHTPGNYWLNLPIYADYDEKAITVTLTPVYHSVRDETPTFFVIEREALLNLLLLPKEGPILVLSLVAFVAGVFLSLFSLFLNLKKKDKRRVFYLGSTAAAAGIWKLCGLSVTPLLLDYLGLQKELWYIGSFGYMIMMVLSLRLLSVIRQSESNRAGTICSSFAAVAAFSLTLLQIVGLAELHDVLIGYGIGMASLHLISLFGEKPSRSELLWLLPFFLFIGADLAIFLYSRTLATAPVFLIWIVLNLFVRGIGFLREAIAKERQLLEREKDLRIARIQILMNQIRPHFLYNTLTSIYMLCYEDQHKAAEVVRDFTTYLQANFTAIAAAEPISFDEELKHTQAYLSVEGMLHEGKLNVTYDADYRAFLLPPLTLQPIVENAVKHGTGNERPPLHIAIHTRAVNAGTELIIEDNGPGFSGHSTNAILHHVGLRNVQERLEMMCGGTLDIHSTSLGTTVRVFLPKPDT